MRFVAYNFYMNQTDQQNNHITPQQELIYLEKEIQDIPQEERKFVEKIVKRAIEEFKPALDKLAYE